MVTIVDALSEKSGPVTHVSEIYGETKLCTKYQGANPLPVENMFPSPNGEECNGVEAATVKSKHDFINYY